MAASFGVRSTDPLALADGANVVVHLRPAPLVAKVAAVTHLVREPAPWLARELALSGYLAGAGLPVVRASDLLPARVHEHDGAVMTFWQHEPHDPTASVGATQLGRMLRELHVVLRSCSLTLPELCTPFEDIGRWLARAGDTAPARMRSAFDRLVTELAGGGGQALHGDPHPGNVLMTARGPCGRIWRTAAPGRSPGTWPVSRAAAASTDRSPCGPTGRCRI